MDDFVQYVSLFDNSFENNIIGASEDEIHKLAFLSNKKLPLFYKQYLIKMGQKNGGINFAPDYISDIKSLIDFYQKDTFIDEIYIPTDFVAIAYDYENCLTCLINCKDESESMVYLYEGENLELYSDSFERLLYRTAFLDKQPNLYSHFRLYTTKKEKKLKLIIAETIAEEMGFQKHWFSDSICYCGETDDSALYMIQDHIDRLSIIVLSNNQLILSEIEKKFMNSIELIMDI